MNHRILIADDEPAILQSVSAYLVQDGFQVITTGNGTEALALFRHEHPALVILDVMMPGLNGWEVARLIRKESSVPLLFLTARVEDIDQVTGLEIGADEYLTKPFSPRVLVAHVRALLRRACGDLSGPITLWRSGDLALNTETHSVTRKNIPIDLTQSEFDLLAVLIAHPGRVFTRMELLDRLQGESYAVYERAIDVHVKNLRAKLDDDPHAPRYVETVYGVGYRFRGNDE
jgi:two-component system alkaline phosphatase synthesis response regulator PhoP